MNSLPHSHKLLSDVSNRGREKRFWENYFFGNALSEADRDIYLPHPAHKAFVELAQPHIKQVLVVDYWTG